MQPLSVLDLSVLETLKRAGMTAKQLEDQTGVPPYILYNILQSLKEANLINQRKREVFELNAKQEPFCRSRNLKHELIDLFAGVIKVAEHDERASIRIYKRWMTPIEMGVYRYHQTELNKLFKETARVPVCGKTKEMSVFIQGHCLYGDLIQNCV